MTEQITIKPEMGMYKVLKHLNYKAWFALSEFVDNSLQSYIAKNGKFGETRNHCMIEIKYDPNERYLSIEDNSYGISERDHQRAFTAGVPPDDASGLSEFGVGMKSAGIWFSPNWKVTTCSIDSETEYTFHMKLDELITGDGTLRPTTRYSPALKGYTRVELFDLHHGIHGRTIGKIKDHLRSIYRCFLREDRLKLTFNGEELRYEEPAILIAKKAWSSGQGDDGNKPVEWKKSIDFKLANGVSVSGFAAIRETGSTKEAGFSIFRRNRVVLGSFDDKFRPSEVFGQSNSFQYQRLFGELHLDGVEVSHTKDNINLGEYEEEFLERLKESIDSEPKQLIKQARLYKAKTLDEKAAKVIQEVASKITRAYSLQTDGNQEDGGVVLGSISTEARSEDLQSLEYAVENVQATVTNLTESKLRSALEKNQEILFNAGGVDWAVHVRVEGIETSKLYALSYRDEESTRPNTKSKNVDIVINKDHELFLEECAGSKEATTVLILLLVTASITELMLTASGNYFARLIHKAFNEQVCNVFRGMNIE